MGVQSNAALDFTSIGPLAYQALLYELRDKVTGATSKVVPNWFGVAIPNPNSFNLSSDVYVVLYFHPQPYQAHYRTPDYPDKTGTNGTDWKQLYAYIDRLGGQMAGAIQSGALANRLVIFPFLTDPNSLPTNEWSSLPADEWFNIIHDILQDINTNVVNGICTTPKKIIVATLSNGSVYLNKFLTDAAASGNQSYNNIIEVWDFDSDISNPQVLVDPHGIHLRAYWQNPKNASIPNDADFVQLPPPSWTKPPNPHPFPNPPPVEIPPLPPNASNSKSGKDTKPLDRIHHYIRDTMFLDAALKVGNP